MERDRSIFYTYRLLVLSFVPALALYISRAELGATSTSQAASTGTQLGTMVQCYFSSHSKYMLLQDSGMLTFLYFILPLTDYDIGNCLDRQCTITCQYATQFIMSNAYSVTYNNIFYRSCWFKCNFTIHSVNIIYRTYQLTVTSGTEQWPMPSRQHMHGKEISA